MKKQKYARVSEDGRLVDIIPRVYVSPYVSPVKKINNQYVKFPLRGAIVKKDDGDGFVIEKGESTIIFLLGYHVDIIDITHDNNVGFVVVHEPEEGVPMSDPWYGGLLLEFSGKTRVKIEYEVNNGVYKGTMIIEDGKITHHKLKDFRGVPVRIRELEQILED